MYRNSASAWCRCTSLALVVRLNAPMPVSVRSNCIVSASVFISAISVCVMRLWSTASSTKDTSNSSWVMRESGLAARENPGLNSTVMDDAEAPIVTCAA